MNFPSLRITIRGTGCFSQSKNCVRRAARRRIGTSSMTACGSSKRMWGLMATLWSSRPSRSTKL